MADEPENLTLRILQELRSGMDELRAEMQGMRADFNQRVDALSDRVDDLSTRVNGNTIILSTIAGLFHAHEERISKLEAR